jgi:hypothetical protein
MANRMILALAAAGLLSGCASNSLRYAVAANPPTPAAEREATVVTMRERGCEFPPPNPSMQEMVAAALAAPLIGMAVDFTVNLIGAELKRLKEGRNALWEAAGATDLLDSSQPAKTMCLSISRGVVVAGAGDRYNALPPGLGFRAEPAFVLQLNLTFGPAAADKPATAAHKPAAAGDKPAAEADKPRSLVAIPYRLAYAETSAPIRGKNRKDVSVLVAISGQTLQPAAGPAQIPDTKDQTAVLRLDFGRLQVGQVYDATLLGTISARTALPAGHDRMITAIVSESENSPMALDALVAAFDSNKSDLSAALKKVIQDAVGGGTGK